MLNCQYIFISPISWHSWHLFCLFSLLPGKSVFIILSHLFIFPLYPWAGATDCCGGLPAVLSLSQEDVPRSLCCADPLYFDDLQGVVICTYSGRNDRHVFSDSHWLDLYIRLHTLRIQKINDEHLCLPTGATKWSSERGSSTVCTHPHNPEGAVKLDFIKFACKQHLSLSAACNIV